MNEKYINDLYSQLGGEEVFGKYEDFVNLITNDDSYIKDFHGNFGEETLGSIEDFTNLVKKKDETTELVSPQEEVVTTSRRNYGVGFSTRRSRYYIGYRRSGDTWCFGCFRFRRGS
jgi:hypothetical protein